MVYVTYLAATTLLFLGEEWTISILYLVVGKLILQ